MTKSNKKEDLIHSLIPLSVSGEFNGDTVGYFYFQNDKKEADIKHNTLTEVEDLVKHKVFTGAAKSAYFIRGSYIEKHNLLVAGFGNKKNDSPEKARQTGAVVFNKLSAEKIKHFDIDVDGLAETLDQSDLMNYLTAFLEGFYLTSYTFEKHKSHPPKSAHKLESVTLVTESTKLKKTLEELVSHVLITVDCIFTTRDFSNEPSNFGTPEYFADEIKKLSKKYDLKCTVLDEAQARKEKMNLFLSVSAGSDREARVVILEYTPKGKGNKNSKTVSLVGKGVTFDSGGISLKPSMKMEDMKHDMTGAAAILGATLLASRLECPNKLVTILVFTENMPSGSATQPGNVITARNGKTVEIINTDAEGRLVLADALDLAQDYKPDVVLNAATLTGACSIALGKLASALFSNDDKLVGEIQNACAETHERLWQLPLYDDYFEDLKSHTADIANVANDSNGGTIRGAIFLKQFIREGQKWAHIDLANTAYDLGYLPYNPRKGASGAYVRTIAKFALDY